MIIDDATDDTLCYKLDSVRDRMEQKNYVMAVLSKQFITLLHAMLRYSTAAPLTSALWMGLKLILHRFVLEITRELASPRC